MMVDVFAQLRKAPRLDLNVAGQWRARPDRKNAFWERVVKLAGRLACPDERFAAWAENVGVECGTLATDQKEDKIHELDAMVSSLYGLKEPQVVHIFETFHEGWDYETRLNGVLKHFRAWKNRR
jgi:hypothetical protein